MVSNIRTEGPSHEHKRIGEISAEMSKLVAQPDEALLNDTYGYSHAPLTAEELSDTPKEMRASANSAERKQI